MTILGLIPARGGSKGVPGKNIRLLCGRPLLAWTIAAARDAAVFDRLVLSTDDPAIAAVGLVEGTLVPFLRPDALAVDTTPMRDVVRHALAAEAAAGHAPDIVVLLQPTSPLRRPGHIREAADIMRAGDCDSVVSVAPVPAHLCPDFVMAIREGVLRPFLPEGAEVRRRQDVRPAWYRDGTIYAFHRATFETFGDIYGRACRPMIVDTRYSLSIDTLADFAEAERRLADILAETAGRHDSP